MAIEIVDLAIKNGGSFRSYVKVYQTVYIYIIFIENTESICGSGPGLNFCSQNPSDSWWLAKNPSPKSERTTKTGDSNVSKRIDRFPKRMFNEKSCYPLVNVYITMEKHNV